MYYFLLNNDVKIIKKRLFKTVKDMFLGFEISDLDDVML